MVPYLPPKRLGPTLPAQLGAQCDSATSESGQAGGGGGRSSPSSHPLPTFRGLPATREALPGTSAVPGDRSGSCDERSPPTARPCGGCPGPDSRRLGRPRPKQTGWDEAEGGGQRGRGRGRGTGGRREATPSLCGRTLGRSSPGRGVRMEAPGKVARVSSELQALLPRSPAGSSRRGSLRAPRLRPAWTPRRPGRRGARGVCVGVLPGGGGPLTISTWRGSSWLGGAGTENWIFLRSLGSMAGLGARLRSGRRSGSAGPRCERRCAGGGGGGCALRRKHPKNTPRRGARRRVAAARLPAAQPAPAPRASPRGSRRPVPAPLPLPPPSRSGSRGVSAAPRCLYLPRPLGVSLRPGLPPAPPPHPPPRPRGPGPAPHLGLAPGAGWEGPGERGQ